MHLKIRCHETFRKNLVQYSAPHEIAKISNFDISDEKTKIVILKSISVPSDF